MKKALSILSTFVLLVAFAPSTWAYSGSVTLDGGQTIYYNYYSNGEYISITYPSGYDYNPWGGYTMPTGALVIPDSINHNGVNRPVTWIENYAFSGCSGLTSVYIPISVTSISRYAFYNCQNLDTVYMMPTMPPIIGDGTFSDNATNRVFILNGCSFDNYYTDYSGDRWSYYRYDLRDPIIDINVTLTNAYIIQQRGHDVRCDSTIVVKAIANNGYHDEYEDWYGYHEAYYSNTGSYLHHWSNGSTANPDTLQLTGDTSLTAYIVTFTVTSSNAYMGSVAREEGDFALQQMIWASLI